LIRFVFYHRLAVWLTATGALSLGLELSGVRF
jgi:hypothetical protein